MTIKKFASIFIYLVIISLLFAIVIKTNKEASNTQTNIPERNLNLKIIDLSKQLKPDVDYMNVSCRISAKYVIETTLCVNDYETDFVSKIIWQNGAFEDKILGIFIGIKPEFILKYKD
jgi:hypothetical protein